MNRRIYRIFIYLFYYEIYTNDLNENVAKMPKSLEN